jgi:hypothetical protein
MNLFGSFLPRRLFALGLLVFALMAFLASSALAQTATAEAAVTATPAGPPTETPTPTITPTPTLTPTATPTLTARQGVLVLAHTYLEGGAYAKAAELYAAIATQAPGDPDALAGLKAALAAQETATAAAAAPPPTPVPPTATPAVTFGRTFARQLSDFTGTALAGLLLILLIYLLAQVIRWLLIEGREFWWMQAVVRFGLRKEPVFPAFYMGEFADATQDKEFPGAKVVVQALTQVLVEWHQIVRPDAPPAVEPAPTLELGGMAWIKLLWSWIIPPPRAYKVTGALLGKPAGPYQLSISRASLARNRVDGSRTFGPQGGSGIAPEAAIRALASEARPWLIDPLDAAAAETVMRSGWLAKGGTGKMRLPGQVIEEVVDELLPVRQQVTRETIDYPDARGRLQRAESLLAELPATSTLRAELHRAIADLRRSVQPGAAG